jgi:hypothetical protein
MKDAMFGGQKLGLVVKRIIDKSQVLLSMISMKPRDCEKSCYRYMMAVVVRKV